MFISKFKFDVEKWKSYASGFDCGLKIGRKEAMYAKYTANEIREIFGLPKCNDGLNIRFSAVDETVNKPAERKGEEDVVNRPKHYTDGKIEVIEFIEDKKLGFCLGNAVKYIARAGKKDPTKEVEDLKKARWYIERRIKEIEESIA